MYVLKNWYVYSQKATRSDLRAFRFVISPTITCFAHCLQPHQILHLSYASGGHNYYLYMHTVELGY